MPKTPATGQLELSKTKDGKCQSNLCPFKDKRITQPIRVAAGQFLTRSLWHVSCYEKEFGVFFTIPADLQTKYNELKGLKCLHKYKKFAYLAVDQLQTDSKDIKHQAMQIRIELLDEVDKVHKRVVCTLSNEASMGELRKEIFSTFQIETKLQLLYHGEQDIHGEFDSTTLESLDVKHESTLKLKHTSLKKWQLYHECVQQVICNSSNSKQLADDVNELNQLLKTSKFYDVYDDFRKFHIQNHRRAIKYLDGEVLVIAAAAREYFLSLYGSQETSGTRCGIICDVKFKDVKQKFQVKTHHHGGSSFSAGTTTDPDIRELYCYKLFELIGVGPEVQFVFPSKDLDSKTATYICTKWRTDFNEFGPKNKPELDPNRDALVQLHLLQIILHVEDIHELNCGQWQDTQNLAIVDFCMGVDRNISKKLFLQKYNSKIRWSSKAEKMFESTQRDDFLVLAKKWLKEDWNFMVNVDKANTLLAQMKDILKAEYGTKFRGYDVDETGEVCSTQVTDDLQQYIEKIKRNAELFLT